jgi:Archaeal phage integrase
MCYAQRYHNILFHTQDASPIVNLQSGAMRRHAMESLTLLAKHRGLSDRWADIRKRYSLKWSGGDNGSVQSLQRFFDESKTVDKMIQWVKQAIATLPDNMAAILRYNVLTGLRPVEVLQSIRLLLLTENNNHLGVPGQQYYNESKQCLEHFRFPDIFIRHTKCAYISFISKEQLSAIGVLDSKNPTIGIPTYERLSYHIRRATGLSMRMAYCRKIFASYLRSEGIQPEFADLLQGRVSQSILTRHYLTPDSSLRDNVLAAIENLRDKL